MRDGGIGGLLARSKEIRVTSDRCTDEDGNRGTRDGGGIACKGEGRRNTKPIPGIRESTNTRDEMMANSTTDGYGRGGGGGAVCGLGARGEAVRDAGGCEGVGLSAEFGELGG